MACSLSCVEIMIYKYIYIYIITMELLFLYVDDDKARYLKKKQNHNVLLK